MTCTCDSDFDGATIGYGVGCDLCGEYYCEYCVNTYSVLHECGICNVGFICDNCTDTYHQCTRCGNGSKCICGLRQCVNIEKETKKFEDHLKNLLTRYLKSDNPATRVGTMNALKEVCFSSLVFN